MSARITCNEFADFIGAYLDGDLEAATREAFESHIERCQSCEHYLAGYRATIDLGRDAFECGDDGALPESVPDDLIEAILKAREKG